MNRTALTGNVTFLFVVGSLVLLNALSVGHFVRLDLTRDKAFTLAEATRETMESLDAPVTITAYFTENLPPPFSDNARYVRDLLEEYRSASNGELSFEFVDPQSQETQADKEIKKDVKRDIFGRTIRDKTSVEEELEGAGIQPVEIRVFEDDQAQTKRAYMGLSIRYGEQKEAIPVIQGVDTFEYDLTALIRKLTRKKTPVIGVVQGHGEPTLEEELQKASQLLSQNYEMRPVTIGSGAEAKIPDDVDALLVIGPDQPYSTEELTAIDSFLMKGKSAGFFLDRVQVDLKTFEPTAVTHEVDTLVEAYGIDIGSQLVGDVSSGELSVPVAGRNFLGMPMMSRVRYPFLVNVRQLIGDSPLSKGLGDIFMPFAAPVYPKKDVSGVDVTVLARSTQKSWLEEGTADAISPRRDWGAADISVTGPYDLIAQARGKLSSKFEEGKKSEGEARIVVTGTSAWLNEQIFGPPNAALLLNTIDWLLLDAKLLEMRTRGLAESVIDPDLSDGARNAVKFGNLIGAPLLLVAYGVFRWSRRNTRRNVLIARGKPT